MLEYLVLFAHFDDSVVARRHLEVLRTVNACPVIPVCSRRSSRFIDAVDVSKLDTRWSDEDPWRAADTLLYRWFPHRQFEAHRYVFLEWDTLATMPIREYYREVWDADAAATAVHTPQSYAGWPWFKELPAELRPFAMGLSPLNGVMLSHRALAAVCAGPLPPNVFCECRLGTALKVAGFQPVALPPAKAATNGFHRSHILLNQRVPGLYHPVKHDCMLDPAGSALACRAGLRRGTLDAVPERHWPLSQ